MAAWGINVADMGGTIDDPNLGIGWGLGAGMPPLVGASTQASGGMFDNGGVWQTIAGLGLDVTKTVLGYNLQQNQINHNQVPSITYDSRGNPIGGAQVAYGANGKPLLASGALATAGNAFSTMPSWIWLVAIALIAIMVIKR